MQVRVANRVNMGKVLGLQILVFRVIDSSTVGVKKGMTVLR